MSDTNERSARFIRGAVLGETRKTLEAALTLKYQKILSSWFRELSDQLLRGGHLNEIVRMAFHTKKQQYPKRQLREIAWAQINSAASLVFESQENLSFVTRAVAAHNEFYIKAYQFGALSGLAAFGLRPRLVIAKAADEFVFGLSEEELLFFLHSRGIKFGRGLTAAVIDDARRMIADGVYLGREQAEDIARKLASGNGVPLWRARRIARTEIQAGFNAALFDMGARSGVRHKIWLTVGDDRVRPQHTDNELAGAIPMREPFPSGQMHPGDGVLAVNCRCSMTYDLSDPGILLDPWDGGPGPFFSDGITDGFEFF